MACFCFRGARTLWGHNVAALDEARQALDGYYAQQVVRGTGDAHRLIAIAYAKLGEARAATEHILEAQRLIEIHGTPYSVLRTLLTKANILGSAPLKMEAIDFARLLQKLGKDPESEVGSRYELVADDRARSHRTLLAAKTER